MSTIFRKFSLATGAAALLALGAYAGAAERGPRTPIDANGDGAVDFAELQARRSDITTEQFNAMDKDGNGQLNRDEMRAAAQQRMQARASERFKKLDANGDGGVSQEELNAARQQAADERFKKLDTDGDGKLSEAEMAAGRQNAARAMGERRGRMDHGEGHGPGPNRGGPSAPPSGV
jgi:Ca2+-binding EF-hand superfamily protein